MKKMKKILLAGLFAIATCAIKAQDYYPSGSLNIPTWYYSYVVSDNDGYFYNPSTSKSGDVIDDAGLYYATFTNGDAYDGAFEFFIGVQDSVYTESGALTGNVDTTGNTISLGEQLIDSFYVSKKYYFSPSEPVVRTTFKIRNPTGVVRSTKVGIYSNLGSDSRTKLDTCFTGNDTLTDADRWMVTKDGSYYGEGDPINTWIRFGPGTIASSPIFGEKPEKGSDDFLDTVAISVPPNSYLLIMQFNRMDSDTLAARTNVIRFNSIATMKASGYFTGMSNDELAKIVNWNLSSVLCENIIVNNPQKICLAGSYTINGHTYTVAGNYNDTLQRVSGCDSIIVTQITVIPADTTSKTASICNGGSYDFYGTSLTSPGINYHTLTSTNGCDSVIALTLVVESIDITTTVKNDTIMANQTDATYQWLDCDNSMKAISNATKQFYKATKTGNYAVVITSGECTDTSVCQNVVGSGTGVKTTNQVSQITIYPNPSDGLFTITGNGIKSIQIFNSAGLKVYQAKNRDLKSTIDIRNEAPGVYLLKITTNEGTTEHSIIKN
jgi:hypothetical protein